MFCPDCKAEYRRGFTHCVDCDVDLVEELPRAAIELRRIGEGGEYRVPGGPGDRNEDPFCSFWKGNDLRVHAELCGILEEAGIPHHTVYRRDPLFNLCNYAAYEVGVPFSMYQRAEAVVKEAYAAQEGMNVGSPPIRPRVLPQGSEDTTRKLPETLTPAEADNTPGRPHVGEGIDGQPLARVKVWSAENHEPGNFLIAALEENGISCRLTRDGKKAELYVLPEHESRAREVVREIVEGAPPA
jgi:hypothetical protein